MSLQLVIGADVRPAINGVKQFNKSMQDVTVSLNQQQTALRSLQQQYAALSSEQVRGSIGKLLRDDIIKVQSEILKLQNVSNNSFNSVSSGASRAFSALSAMAGVLPGVGIAGIVGFASTAIAGLFGIGEEADSATKKLQELLRPLQDLKSAAAAGAEEELAKVRALTAIVVDQTKSYSDRNAALNQLKEINKSYFGDLDLEKDKLTLIRDRANEYTQAIINQAVLKSFSDEIGKASIELVKEQKALEATRKEIKKFQDENIRVSKENKTIAGTALPVISPQAQIGLINATEKFKEQNKVVTALTDRIGELRGEIQAAVNQSIQLRPLQAAKESVKRDSDDIVARWKRAVNDLKETFIIPVELVINPLDTKEQEKAKAKEFFRRLEDDAQNRLRRIPFELKPIPLDIDVPQTRKNFQDKLADPTLIFGGKNHLILKVILETEKEEEEKLKRYLDSLNGIVSGGVANIAASFSEGLGNLLVGAGDVGDLFSGVFQSIGASLQTLGRAMIAHAIAIKAFKNAFVNPVAELAAGAALIIAGSAVKAAVTAKFAQGGLVFGPALGMVGEGQGTSRSNPEVIAPLDKLKNYINPIERNTQPVVLFRLTPSEMIAWIARGERGIGLTS